MARYARSDPIYMERGGAAGDPVTLDTLTEALADAGGVRDAQLAADAAIAESKLALASDAAAGTASRRTLGTGATQACAGNDARLTDTRTPTDGSVTAAKLAAALKPSGSAAVTDEALRALGTARGTACAGDDARLTKTFRTTHTVAIQGAVTTAPVPGFFVAAASGQTVRLTKVRRLIGAGTSVSFRVQRNGSDITGFGTSGSPLRATTTAGDDDPTDVTLAADDLLTLVVSAVSGAPTDLVVTLVLEHTV